MVLFMYGTLSMPFFNLISQIFLVQPFVISFQFKSTEFIQYWLRRRSRSVDQSAAPDCAQGQRRRPSLRRRRQVTTSSCHFAVEKSLKNDFRSFDFSWKRGKSKLQSIELNFVSCLAVVVSRVSATDAANGRRRRRRRSCRCRRARRAASAAPTRRSTTAWRCCAPWPPSRASASSCSSRACSRSCSSTTSPRCVLAR